MTVAIGDPKPKLKPGANIPPADIQAVEDFFDANKEAHLKEASLDLGITVGKIYGSFQGKCRNEEKRKQQFRL